MPLDNDGNSLADLYQFIERMDESIIQHVYKLTPPLVALYNYDIEAEDAQSSTSSN